METLFWVLLLLAAYSYLGYPLLLLLLPARKWNGNLQNRSVTRVSIIIAARNEGGTISAKLESTLALISKGIELEIVVASDASDDRTDDIVRTFADRGVILARSPERKGKEEAQRVALSASTGDVIVFTDTGTTISEDAIPAIVAAFNNPDIGALSSVDRIVEDDGKVQGEGLYVRYEMWLRDLEARYNTLVGLSGSFFAARRAVCQDWDIRIPSDFGIALNCARYGYRAVSDRNVVGFYRNLADPSREYSRKLRTVLRGMMGLRVRAEVLNPLRYGRFAFQVASHKLMRWAVPWLLLAAWLVNWGLLEVSTLYLLSLSGLTALFMLPLLQKLMPSIRRVGLLRIAAFFVEANVAILHASTRMLRGRTMLTWEPSKR